MTDSEGLSLHMEELYKQFILESERIDHIFQSLESQCRSVQTRIDHVQIQMNGKLSELDFMTHYLDAILSHISQGLIFIDMRGMITTYNPAAEAIFQIKSEQVLFHPFNQIFHDQIFGFSIQEVLHSKAAIPLHTIVWQRSSGEKMDLEIETSFVERRTSLDPLAHARPLQSPIQGLLVLVRNVTEVRRLQLLNQRRERLQELGELAATVAHEIRNPLGGMKGFATLLQHDLKSQPNLQHMATAIIQGTEELSRFVNRILHYTRPFHLQLEQIDLVSFIKDILELIKADKAFHTNIKCFFDSPILLHVHADPALLKAALLNILVNALQAMPQGGDLKISLIQETTETLIKIEDTGIGMSSDDVKRAFTPFFTKKEGGSGLGLAEVYKVIQAHQGLIDLQSEIGKGTLFTIHLPLQLVGV